MPRAPRGEGFIWRCPSRVRTSCSTVSHAISRAALVCVILPTVPRSGSAVSAARLPEPSAPPRKPTLNHKRNKYKGRFCLQFNPCIRCRSIQNAIAVETCQYHASRNSFKHRLSANSVMSWAARIPTHSPSWRRSSSAWGWARRSRTARCLTKSSASCR